MTYRRLAVAALASLSALACAQLDISERGQFTRTGIGAGAAEAPAWKKTIAAGFSFGPNRSGGFGRFGLSRKGEVYVFAVSESRGGGAYASGFDFYAEWNNIRGLQLTEEILLVPNVAFSHYRPDANEIDPALALRYAPAGATNGFEVSLSGTWVHTWSSGAKDSGMVFDGGFGFGSDQLELEFGYVFASAIGGAGTYYARVAHVLKDKNKLRLKYARGGTWTFDVTARLW